MKKTAMGLLVVLVMAGFFCFNLALSFSSDLPENFFLSSSGQVTLDQEGADSQGEETLNPVKRIIAGKGESSLIRVFTWENVSMDEGIEIYQFDPYSHSWAEILPNQNWLNGIYKLVYPSNNAYTFRGEVSSNLGGTMFQQIDPIDMLIFLEKSKKELAQVLQFLRESKLKIYLACNTEGYCSSDVSYWDGIFPGHRVVAVLPCNSRGYADVGKISDGTAGISLPAEVPHFIFLAPDH